jgi:hypothetical protein
VSDSYFRFLIGPKAAVGTSYFFGKFGFNLEFGASARFSPFVDKNYKEVNYILALPGI